jgi:HSP20 family molecular chaperone IbpA
MPINQSKAPLPKPIVSSSGKLHRDINSVLQTRFHPCTSAESTPSDNQDGNPPYDIVRTGEESFRISVALAGFTPSDIAITAQQNLLTVAGRRADNPEHDYVYKGISARPFERRFSLADHVEVERAHFEDGLL